MIREHIEAGPLPSTTVEIPAILALWPQAALIVQLMPVLFPEISLVMQEPIPYHLSEVETRAPGHSAQKAGVEGLPHSGRDAQVGKYGSWDGKEGSFGDSCSRVLETKVVRFMEREEGLESVFCAWTSSS